MGNRHRKKPAASTDQARRIAVRDYYETCSTRERARKFYPILLERLERAPSWGELRLSFEGVKFVSPSVLDDLLVRLAEDRPEIAKRLVITGLSPYAVKRLTSILDRRNLSWTLRPRENEGEYSLAD